MTQAKQNGDCENVANKDNGDESISDDLSDWKQIGQSSDLCQRHERTYILVAIADICDGAFPYHDPAEAEDAKSNRKERPRFLLEYLSVWKEE